MSHSSRLSWLALLGQRWLTTLMLGAAVAVGAITNPAAAEKKVGIVLLHGKFGGPVGPHWQALTAQMQGAGMLVRGPELPWSRNRYLDGDVDKAMTEIAREVAALRQAGAQSVILLGHSMGTAAAITYAALKGDVEGIVLTAPGHVPVTYQQMDFMRDALATAKRMVAAGQGGETAVFADSNQGQRLSPRMKAADYVSWFDPEGAAEMSRMAGKVRPGTAAFMVVGDQDRIVSVARATIFDRMPPDRRNAYVQIKANHVTTLTEGAPHFMGWLKARAGDPE